MVEQIKCIKSGRIAHESEDCFTEGKIYPASSYNKAVGYGVTDDTGQSHWVYEPGHEYFDSHFELIEEE